MTVDGSSAAAAYPLAVVSAKIGGWIDRLGAVWVQGQLVEVNLRSTMVYAKLRDERQEVSMDLKLSKLAYDSAGQPPQGTVVAAWVKPDFYAKNGRLSLFAKEIRPVGTGSLLLRVEQLKRQLQAEGLFAASLKRALPLLPGAIGLITGADSAAERDVVENVTVRWPAARIEVRHTLVQGPRAAAEVMAAVAELDRHPAVDVIIIARGGGSFEDLLPFSDEGLVRAVAASRTPVISAVGHETDTPLLDYVADVRVSTPTGAAKIVVPDAREEAALVAQWRERARQAVLARVGRESQTLAALRSRPVLQNPVAGLDAHRDKVAQLTSRLQRATDAALRSEQHELARLTAQLRALSPKSALERGYSILFDDTGTPVTSTAQVTPGQEIAAYVADGQLYLVVQEDE